MLIKIPRFNSRTITFTLKDAGHESLPPLDLIGEKTRVIFTVKEHLPDDESLIRIQKDTLGGGVEITNASGGEVNVTLTPGDLNLPPSDYYYDIFVKIDDDAYSCDPDIFRVTPTVLGVLP